MISSARVFSPSQRKYLVGILQYVSGAIVGLKYKYQLRAANERNSDNVYLDISDFYYGRYFYSFIKFFNIEGVRLDIRLRPKTFYRLSGTEYGNMVLSERLVSIASPVANGRIIGDGDADVILAPYDFLPSRKNSQYNVPMTMHPSMYSRGFWNKPIERTEARATILFIGNSNAELYSELDAGDAFDMISRIRLCELLEQSAVCRRLQPGESVPAMKSGDFIWASSENRIPRDRFRQTLGDVGFFLCAPGVFMPLCHNLIEAMSVGAIPLIQRSYAELLEPPLEHGVNAMVFNGEDDLLPCVNEALHMDPIEITDMKQRVLDYYEQYLTPSAVVSRILAPETKEIRLLTGKKSVDMLVAYKRARKTG